MPALTGLYQQVVSAPLGNAPRLAYAEAALIASSPCLSGLE
jgi:hypothetical protein